MTVVRSAKLRAPRPRRSLVARSRLTGRLRDGSLPRLVLVSAPAGFGKTTLLAEALTGSDERRVAWLSLDAGDNDPRQFLVGLVAAAHATDAEVGVEAAQLLEGERMPPAEAVLAALVNDLDLYAGPTVLALDDYHVIEAEAVHEAVAFLLDQLPPHCSVAMTTRVDPPFPLARLRARGELVEVRANDLRFTVDEAEAFLNNVMGLSLDDGQVAALEARTEGWAAGLQLAALSARGHESASATSTSVTDFVEAFSGSHRFVLDYLLEEVLAGQPGDVRSFLLETSVLDQMTGGLCDAVTGRSDSQAMLEHLERANLFVIPLDDERTWFRYHHLFADALQSRLRSEDAPRLSELHQAASDWYAGQGVLGDAIDHALAASDTERAADLVELAVPRIRKNRENRTLRVWLHALPESVLRSRALLAAIFAWTRLSEGDLDAVDAWLDAAESALRGGAPSSPSAVAAGFPGAAREWSEEWANLPGTIAVYRASLAQARGDIDGTVAQARRALELAGPTDHSARAGGAGFLALAEWLRGDVVSAMDTFGETVRSLHAAGFTADELGTTVVVGELWLARGRPDEARRAFERALGAAEQYMPGGLPVAADLHAGLAEMLCESGELDEAEAHLRAARTLDVHSSFVENEHRWFVAMSRLLRAGGDLEGAVNMLDRAEPLFIPGFFPDVRPIAAMRARVRIAQGLLSEGWTWAGRRQVEVDAPAAYGAEFDQLTLVRLVVAQHQITPDDDSIAGAEELLDRILSNARTVGRDGSVIEAQMLRALVRDARGDRDQALVDLSTALESAVPAGYVRLFLDEGAPMERLLRAVAATRSPVGQLATQLLRSAGREPRAPGASIHAVHDDDQLSERELEVLRLLATELTGPEIAGRLFVSINTLRTHTKHIFTKLGVKTRRAAVLHGQELGLLQG